MGSGYADYTDALDSKYGDPFPVPIVVATEETLKGYGTIVREFDNAKVEITPWPVKGSTLYNSFAYWLIFHALFLVCWFFFSK